MCPADFNLCGWVLSFDKGNDDLSCWSSVSLTPPFWVSQHGWLMVAQKLGCRRKQWCVIVRRMDGWERASERFVYLGVKFDNRKATNVVGHLFHIYLESCVNANLYGSLSYPQTLAQPHCLYRQMLTHVYTVAVLDVIVIFLRRSTHFHKRCQFIYVFRHILMPSKLSLGVSPFVRTWSVFLYHVLNTYWCDGYFLEAVSSFSENSSALL